MTKILGVIVLIDYHGTQNVIQFSAMATREHRHKSVNVRNVRHWHTVLWYFFTNRKTANSELNRLILIFCLDKVSERLDYKQLIHTLHSSHILSDLQFGFRTGHRCSTTSVKVPEDIITAVDAQQVCVDAFLERTKSFDFSQPKYPPAKTQQNCPVEQIL